jgi:hypothetical protein
MTTAGRSPPGAGAVSDRRLLACPHYHLPNVIMTPLLLRETTGATNRRLHEIADKS